MQLHRDREQIERTGARLVLIGQASPRQAAWFRKRFAPDLTVLADEKRASYKAVGAKKGTFMELLGPKVIAKGAIASARSGVVQGRTVGHPAQLGGVLVVKPGGSIAYAHLADDASDNAPNGEVIEAARAAA